MTHHDQVWAKVNVPVDGGVAGIVEALSLFPGLETIESCEGSVHDPAWVCFRYGRYWDDPWPWRELAEFVLGQLAPKLAERVGDSAGVLLRPRVDGVAVADLSIRPEAKEQVEKAIREIASEFNAAPHRNLAYSDGKSDTSQGRC